MQNSSVDFRSLAGSICSEATAALGTTGQDLDPTGFPQAQQNISCSPLTGASGLGDADYALDTSDWLLENEVFELFDFRSLRSGSPETQIARERDNSPRTRDLRDVWYVPVAKNDIDLETNENATLSRQATDLRDDIDEAYRADMATTLLPPVRNEPLPSIDLLVSHLSLFS